VEAFLRSYRLQAAEREALQAAPELRPAARAEAERYGRALGRLDALGGEALEAFGSAAAERNVALIPSAASHPVLPLVATAAGRRLQIDAGLRSHSRRFGPSEGFWLPECAYRPGIEPLLAERGLRFFCTDQSAHEPPSESLAPARAAAGMVAFTLDRDAVDLVWSPRGYPSDPVYADFHRLSMEGMRLWSIGGGPYDPVAAWARAESHAGEFADAVAQRLREFRGGRGKSGLVTFAVDTELLGHWWSEGPIWLGAVLRLVGERGVRLLTLPEALERHPPEERPLRESSWGEGRDLRTWDSPEVADLAWAARRLELRLVAAVGGGALTPPAAERGARELLAVQASDWAFLDRRKQAGDYPYQRLTDHARALLEAIHSREPPDPRMRNLAPDLSLVPLREP
jgi:1,4-alpha-glucan branching enzyme